MYQSVAWLLTRGALADRAHVAVATGTTHGRPTRDSESSSQTHMNTSCWAFHIPSRTPAKSFTLQDR